ncbi:hypothetical protein NL529_28755, partial [Klebsiella pneumoniae]|nr:hypothetical protein [Klebsiella pneumoniae]
MTPEQVEASERRVAALMTRRWNWKSRTVRKSLIAAGVPKAEVEVVVAYKRSEDRPGMGRTHRVLGTSKLRMGYKTEPEQIVEFLG